MTYSIIGILAAVILLIINRDALWGILDTHRLTALQYADTALHFAAMIAAVMLWTRYAVSYLENETRLGSLLCRTGSLFFLAELIVIGVNFFYPVLFRFDENGGYHAGILRYVTLAVQILMFLLTSGYTLSVTIRSEGVDKVRIRHGRREDYDLLLIDWKMPEMDGLETTRQIRAFVGQETPIIILTSYSWDDIAEEARKAGVDTFVPKPLFAGSVMDQFRDAFMRKNAALEKKTADLKGRRVLLAEDVPVNAEIILMLLSMREMEADRAENGRVAVELFRDHEPGCYDAVLMDMRMPEMDGLEATRAMDRPDAKTIPIIALTANAFDEDVQRSMQAGLNAHLSKPVDAEALFGTLESLIGSAEEHG